MSTETAEPFAVFGRRLGVGAYVAAIALAFLVLVARRPGGVLRPTLWAEDGAIFMHDAYLHPAVSSIVDPYNGYLHVLVRLWAEITTAMPITALARSYSVASLLAAALCYSLILSRRLRWLIPSDAARALGFVALVALPGTNEITGSLTNLLWPVAIALFLLSLSGPPASRLGRAGELAAVGVMGVTGAATFLVAPGFALRWIRTRVRHDARVVAVNLASCVVQATVLLSTHRSGAGFGLLPRSIMRAFVLRVWGTLFVGEATLRPVIGKPVALWLLALCCIGIAVTIAALVALPMIARVHIVVTFVAIVAATSWAFNGDLTGMAESTNGARYYVLPGVVVLVAVLAAASVRWRIAPVRGAAVAVGAVFAFAVVADFRLPERPPSHWEQVAACIKRARACPVPVAPPGFCTQLVQAGHDLRCPDPDTFTLPPVTDVRR